MRAASLLFALGLVLMPLGWTVRPVGKPQRDPSLSWPDPTLASRQIALAAAPDGTGTRRALRLRATAFPRIPLHFEANVGQADPRVRFLARRGGSRLFSTPTEIVLSVGGPHFKGLGGFPAAAARRSPRAVLRLSFEGANPNASAFGMEPLPGKSHYLVGRDPRGWRTSLPTYARVRYSQTYPGIDLVLYGSEDLLEYDFIVAPRGNANDIRLRVTGAERLFVDEASGTLEMFTAAGRVELKRPAVYQETGGARTIVPAHYKVEGELVRFQIGDYDRSLPLVIDPAIAYSTYLGGGGGEFPFEFGFGIRVDAQGNMYVAGEADATDFPVDANPGGADAFVVKLDRSGQLVYSAVVGGNNDDLALGLAVDGQGRAILAGLTESDDFPRVNAFQDFFAGGEVDPDDPLALATDAFVAVLDPAGAALEYASYAGGRANDLAFGVAVDGRGSIHVAGWTASDDFPTANAWQPAFGGAGAFGTDAFFFKVNPRRVGGDSLLVSTYVGGSGNDIAFGVATDGAGNSYVSGLTLSSDFPVVNPFQSQLAGGLDAMVVKFDASGSHVLYASYLGGASSDLARSIAVDRAGNAYLTGSTFSSDFPVRNAFQGENRGLGDAFLAKLTRDGSDLVFSTYFGGSNRDEAFGVAVDAFGFPYLTGRTESPKALGFPLKEPLQDFGGGRQDAFLARLRPEGAALEYSTYLGGAGDDAGLAIATDRASTAYVTGWTSSSDFPTTADAVQKELAGGTDVIVVKVTSHAHRPFTLEVRALLDVQCDGTFNTPPDRRLAGVPVKVRFPGGERLTMLTDPLGQARFSNLEVSDEGIAVKLFLPPVYQGRGIQPCPGSPTRVLLHPEDFGAERFKRLEFRATPRCSRAR